MTLVPSLLKAIIRVDGEALVMHPGDKPYVVSPTGQIELADKGLTLEAVDGIVGQLLSAESQNALDEFGAVQYELPAYDEVPGEHFTIVAARGGDDLWVEIRRRRVVDSDSVPDEFFAPSTIPSAETPSAESVEDDRVPMELVGGGGVADAAYTAPALESIRDETLTLPDANQLWPAAGESSAASATDDQPLDEPDTAAATDPVTLPWQHEASEITPPQTPTEIIPPRPVAPPSSAPPPVSVAPLPAAVAPPPAFVAPPIGLVPPPAVVEPPLAAVEPSVEAVEPSVEAVEPPVAVAALPAAVAPPPAFVAPPVAVAPPPAFVAPPVAVAPPPAFVAPPVALAPPPAFVAPPIALAPLPAAVAPPLAAVEAPRPNTDSSQDPRSAKKDAPRPEPAVVLPMARNPVRSEYAPPPFSDPTMAGLERLLRLAAARGASTLYLSTGARPSVRVDGELLALEGEAELASRDVESLLLTLMPDRSHEALRTGSASEWICEIEDVGRVRCLSFRDHVGPGGVFRLMPERTVSVDQLGLPKQVTALAIEPEGLVLVVGPRSSGKRTLIAALVDQINRTRRDHVITVEREISIVHQRGSSFISQREVRGNDEDLLTAARAALREDPDVLVIEDLRTGGLMNVALEASASGRLVIGGFPAHTATAAIDRIIDLYAPEYRRQVQLALADNLRGVVVQVLLRKIGGGRTPARELLLNTASVSGVIAEGKTSQLPMAIEGGRRHGMMPLSDALVGLVHHGLVDAREAYRHASDRAGLLAAFKRQGIDTSFAEKLA